MTYLAIPIYLDGFSWIIYNIPVFLPKYPVWRRVWVSPWVRATKLQI